MWSSVTTLSATSTGFSSGSSSMEVLSRISPASGASRLSIAIEVVRAAAGLQNGVRWKPMRTGVFYPQHGLWKGPLMTTLEELLRTRVARFVDRQPDWDAFADARVEGY